MGERTLIWLSALQLPMEQTAGGGGAEGINTVLLIVIAVLLVLLLAFAVFLYFLYRTGKLVLSPVEKSVTVVGDLGNTALTSGRDVLTTTVTTTGGVVTKAMDMAGTGIASLSGALREFCQKRDSHSIYIALTEIQPTLEVITCKVPTMLLHMEPRDPARNKRQVHIKMMKVQVSYGFDFRRFTEQDVRFDAETGEVRIQLPPLKILAVERGVDQLVYTKAGRGAEAMELEQLVREGLERRCQLFASSEETLNMAEELSRHSFRQLVETMFHSLPAESRPTRIELVPCPREEGPLIAPEPLRLEAHHDPAHDLTPREERDEEEEDSEEKESRPGFNLLRKLGKKAVSPPTDFFH